MLRFMSTILLSAIAVPALAAPPEPVMMTRDGNHYRYTTELKGQLIAIRGEQLDTGEIIDLVVDRQGRVDGMIGATSVSFTVPRERRDSIAAKLASAPLVGAQLAAVR